jgi:serine/threonine protein kinase
MYGPPPLPIACEIIRQAALGLQHAHEKGMVHRDLKPANLMVSRPQSTPDAPTMAPGWPVHPLVKILDFGLARLQCREEAIHEPDRPLTREGTVVGTPEFMSPEQATDSRLVDVRSDIYSLGCTTLMEVLLSQKNDPPPPLQQARPDIHPALVAVVDRMLAKRPEERFQTPKEVARALKPWSQSSIAPSTTSETLSLGPQGVASPYRETPRSGIAIPTLADKPRSSSIGWILGGMALAIALLCFALFIFGSYLTRLTEPSPPAKAIQEAPKKAPPQDHKPHFD